MIGPQAVSANALSKRVGSQTADVVTVAARGQTHRGEQSVTSAASLEGSAFGELLRREGLHEADVRGLREEALAGLALRRRSGPARRGERYDCARRRARRRPA